MFDDPGDAVLHLFGELEERLQDTVIDPVGMGRAVLGEQAGGGFVLAPEVGRFHVGGEFEHQVVAVGDEAEATYLEVKIRLDMNSKATAAKIAKFLLGAANRRPGEAARHFHGYAVLVIGAQKHSAPGVLRGTEAHELEDRLRPYLGPQFPAFEFGRIGIDSDHEVLFIIAQPPEDGQTIFPCHKSYQGADRNDNIEDGAIYVRGTSNTRPARSGEVLALVERVRRGGKPPIDLDVQRLGPICRVDRVDEILEILRRREEDQFTKQLTPAEDTADAMPFKLTPNVFGNTKPLSSEDREQALAAWQNKKDEHIAKGREHFLGVGLPGAGVQVVSRDRFVAKPHLILTFHNCEVLDYLDPDDAEHREGRRTSAAAARPVLVELQLLHYPALLTGLPRDLEHPRRRR
ncbi:hypothetical protein [Streptomyces griseus]|uniref:hypothetical protein n=1 Tax=Streptomyces griseus TaxID=1911 RepID=UPI0036A5EBA6